jgi:hypothetical protein
MVIDFIGSIRNLEKDLPYYKKIIEVIHDKGNVLARDWISIVKAAGDPKSYRENSSITWTDVHNENVNALKRSDAVIIEATALAFQQGFFTALALQRKKPTLMLIRDEDISQRPLGGFKYKLLTSASYTTEEELEKIVAKFIRANTISTKDLRFNFFIDRHIYNFLREESYDTGKNRSEIIRNLIEKEIEQRDND